MNNFINCIFFTANIMEKKNGELSIKFNWLKAEGYEEKLDKYLVKLPFEQDTEIRK